MTPLTSANKPIQKITICPDNSIAAINVEFFDSLMANFNGDNVCPCINVTLNNTEHNFLYDTGASRTCMSTDHFFHIFPNGIPMTENTAKSPGLKDASGNSLDLCGIFPISLTIYGKTVINEVWVCNKINDLIIGADFINSHHLQYDTLSRSIQFRNKPHAPILSLKEVTHFEALMTTIVKTKFSGDLPLSQTHIAFIFNGNHSLLQGGPAFGNK